MDEPGVRSSPASNGVVPEASSATETPAVPGSEFPGALYVSLAAAFGWMLAAAWVAFGTDADTDLDLAIVVVLSGVFLGIPLIFHRVARSWWHVTQAPSQHLIGTTVDTATGSVPGAQAWIEVLIIPVALAIAATMIGAVYVLVT